MWNEITLFTINKTKNYSHCKNWPGTGIGDESNRVDKGMRRAAQNQTARQVHFKEYREWMHLQIQIDSGQASPDVFEEREFLTSPRDTTWAILSKQSVKRHYPNDLRTCVPNSFTSRGFCISYQIDTNGYLMEGREWGGKGRHLFLYRL